MDYSQRAKVALIGEIGAAVGLHDDELELYGKYKAKVDLQALRRLADRQDGKLILVTAINPTAAGEGKTTTSIGLADALRRLEKNVVLALREPSMGPVFGVKGGATGGGQAVILPAEDINLHFTGDIHAVGAANNLLAALIDNHIYQGNQLGIDPGSVTFKRCVDLNDRQLRFVVDGLGGAKNGAPREDGFDITAASEVMAVFCLSRDIAHLKENLKRIVVGYTWGGSPVTAGDLKAHGAMAALLKDAIKPNLVQTAEQTPAFVHGGPFANIAHGCNSVIATKLALKLGDIVVTEAGFGADLGAEKFCDIKCRIGDITPSLCVIVASTRALKNHGGSGAKAKAGRSAGVGAGAAATEAGGAGAGAASTGGGIAATAACEISSATVAAGHQDDDYVRLERGIPNLLRHIENMRTVFNLPVVVAINRFTDDTSAEHDLIVEMCSRVGAVAVVSDVWARGGAGGEDLARAVLNILECDGTTPIAAAGTTPITAADATATGAEGGATAAATNNVNNAVEPAAAHFKYAYDADLPIREKINAVARSVYGADGVDFDQAALKEAARLNKLGFGGLPICIAKTQYSFSDNAKKLGAPKGFRITVRGLKLQAGAGFIVALTGDIMTMPGLPKAPASERIDVDDMGCVTGLMG